MFGKWKPKNLIKVITSLFVKFFFSLPFSQTENKVWLLFSLTIDPIFSLKPITS